jgi:arylsulfatase A-like enzyme
VTLWFLAGLLAGGALAGTFAPALGAEPANVLLISVDTLRSDRLGCYGYDRPTSPGIDALARRGVRFENVITESSWTLPSHMTLFTGLVPTTHGVTTEERRLPDEIGTWPETLRDAGYRTAAYTDGGMIDGRFGFARGFETYDDRPKDPRLTLYRGLKFVESAPSDQPWFLFLHTYAVHCPYDPPDEYAQRFRTVGPADTLAVEGKCGNNFFNALRRTPAQDRFLSDQYDAGIRAVDEHLRAFFEELESRGVFDDTWIVLLSDHGEELGEHGRIGHERTLHIETLRVPWIVTGPGLSPGVVREAVGLVDFVPTFGELLGLPARASQGISRVAAMRTPGRAGESAPRFSELDRHVRLRSLVDDGRHLILGLDGGAVGFFELATDPWERTNLGAKSSAPWEARLRQHFDELPLPAASATTAMPPELVEELKALGYVQ